MSSEDNEEARQRKDQNLRRQAESEQGLAGFADMFPAMWHRMYRNLISEGFKETEAFTLVAAHVHGSGGGKFNA